MAHTNQWDENSPTFYLPAVNMDDEVVKLRVDLRERSAVDHEFASADGAEAWRGIHTKVTLKEQIASPTLSGDQMCLFRKTGDTPNDLRLKDNNGNEHLIVAVGVVGMFMGVIPDGWLLLNGETIGSAGSAADNADDKYEYVFKHIWNNVTDAHAPVTGGRGASADEDWSNNKAIQVLDARSRVPLMSGAGSGLTVRTLGDDGVGGETKDVSHSHTIAHSHVIPTDNHSHSIEDSGPYTIGANLTDVYSHNHGGATGTTTPGTTTDGSATQDIMNPFLAVLLAIKY